MIGRGELVEGERLPRSSSARGPAGAILVKDGQGWRAALGAKPLWIGGELEGRGGLFAGLVTSIARQGPSSRDAEGNCAAASPWEPLVGRELEEGERLPDNSFASHAAATRVGGAVGSSCAER